MSEPSGPGMDEAVEAACRAFYLAWDWDDDEDPEDQAHCRREMGKAIDAARPIIEAAVRAEQDGGREVERAMIRNAASQIQELVTALAAANERAETAERELAEIRAHDHTWMQGAGASIFCSVCRVRWATK